MQGYLRVGKESSVWSNAMSRVAIRLQLQLVAGLGQQRPIRSEREARVRTEGNVRQTIVSILSASTTSTGS